MTAPLYRRRAGEPVEVWEVGTEPVPEWVDIETLAQCEGLRGHGYVIVNEPPSPVLRSRFAIARDYEPVPSPAVLGTPAGNAAVVAKLHELAASVGMVLVPDPDKLARCGGLPEGWFARDVDRAAKRAEQVRNPLSPTGTAAGGVREALSRDRENFLAAVRALAEAKDMLDKGFPESALARVNGALYGEAALARMGGGS